MLTTVLTRLRSLTPNGETVRQENFRFQAILWEILAVQRNDAVRVAVFGAYAKGVVLGVRGNLDRGANIDFFGSLTNEINYFADQVWTDAEAL